MKNFMSTSILFCCFLLVFSGCKKDEEKGDTFECDNYITIGGTAEMNGEDYSISVADLDVTLDIFSVDRYRFSIGGVETDCDRVRILNFDLNTELGVPLEGTFEIITSQDGDPGYADGDFVAFGLVTNTDVTSTKMESGTVLVKRNGDNDYDIDMDILLVGGSRVIFSCSRKF